MWSVVQYSLEKQGVEYNDYATRLMSDCRNQLLETLVKALDLSAERIQEIKDEANSEDDDEASNEDHDEINDEN